MVEPGAIVFIVFGSFGLAFVCCILLERLINQMKRRNTRVAVAPDIEETNHEEYEEELKTETKYSNNEEIRGINFV